MKLFYSTASPYARTAQILLREVKLDPTEIEIQTHPFDNNAEFLKANPLGKVPCLITDNDEGIFDSEIICQYLDAEFNQGNLWQPVQSSWSLRTTYSLISGLLDLAVARRQEIMRNSDGLKSEFWWQRFNDGLRRGFEELENRIVLMPDGFNLLDINLACLIDYMAFRHSDLDCIGSHTMSRFQLFQNRPSIKQTQPSD